VKKVKQQKSYHQKGKVSRILRQAVSLILCAVLIAGTAPESLAGILAVKDNVAKAKAAAGAASTVYVLGQELSENGDMLSMEDVNDAILWKTAELTVLELNNVNGAWYNPPVNSAGYEFASGKTAAIYADGDLTILLRNGNENGDSGNFSIYCDGTGVTNSVTLTENYGIYAQSLTLPETAQHVDITATVKQVGSDVEGESRTLDCDMDSKNVTLTANGGAVETVAVTSAASYGILAESAYTQHAGAVTVSGGSVTDSGGAESNKQKLSCSCGLFTNNYIQSGGAVVANGGKVTGYQSDSYAYDTGDIQSVGVWIGAQDAWISANLSPFGTGTLGSMEVSGGTLRAVGGEVVENTGYTAISMGILAMDTEEKGIMFRDCEVYAEGGADTDPLGGTLAGKYNFSMGMYVLNNMELSSGTKLIACTGNANRVYALHLNKLVVSGGEIEAYASGGRVEVYGIYASEITVKKDSQAVVKGVAASATNSDNSSNGTSKGIQVGSGGAGQLTVEPDSEAQITAIGGSAHNTVSTGARSSGLTLGGAANIASGAIHAQLRDVNEYTFGGALLIQGMKPCEVSGGTLMLEVEGRDDGSTINLTAGIMTCDPSSEFNQLTALQMTGGEMQIIAKGGYVPGIYLPGNPELIEVVGGSLEIKSEFRAVTSSVYENYKDWTETQLNKSQSIKEKFYAKIFDGSIVRASASSEGTGAELLDGSIYNTSELSTYKYVKAVSGTENAPYIADVDFTQKYSLSDITAELADTLPSDAGVIRYVAGEATVKDKNGADSANTSISGISIN